MLNQDPPQHTRLRNLVARGFTPKVIKAMEPHIREAAKQIVERQLGNDDVIDFVPELRGGAPARRHRRAARRARTRTATRSSSGRTGSSGNSDSEYNQGAPDEAIEASMELYVYAQSLADDRRERPMDDIVTTLVTAELDGEQLSDIEFNVFVLLLVGGGQRDDPEPDQRRDAGADGAPGAARRGSSPTCAGTAATRRRRDAALREPGAVLPAHRDRRHRAARRADRRRATRSRSGTAPRTATRTSSTDPHGFDVTRSPERAHRVRRSRPALLPRARAWRRWRSR